MASNLKEPGQLLFSSWSINLDEVPLEQLDYYIAVENYLTDDYEPPADATNLDKVRGYLAAFHHLCYVEDWKKASEVITIRLDTPTNEELHNQLATWGYYRELVDLYSTIVGKLSPSWDAIFFMVWARFTMFWESMPRRLSILSRVWRSHGKLETAR